MTTPLTANNLKNTLWENLQKVKAKKMSPVIANTVAASARVILGVVNTEMRLAKMHQQKPKTNGFIEFSTEKK